MTDYTCTKCGDKVHEDKLMEHHLRKHNDGTETHYTRPLTHKEKGLMHKLRRR